MDVYLLADLGVGDVLACRGDEGGGHRGRYVIRLRRRGGVRRGAAGRQAGAQLG